VTRLNQVAVNAARTILSGGSTFTAQQAASHVDLQANCHVSWLAGRVALAQADLEQTRAAWLVTFRCNPMAVTMAHKLTPSDGSLADEAIQQWPSMAESWFWKAEFLSGSSPQQSIAFYRRGLELNPSDGLRWRELGDLLRRDDPRAAMAAYAQSCYNADPGSNGCSNAGAIAEQSGDLQRAIFFYRLSQQPSMQQRAEQLEQQLQSQGGP
jgi:tetratricopeptide (TPR) repeat protein